MYIIFPCSSLVVLCGQHHQQKCILQISQAAPFMAHLVRVTIAEFAQGRYCLMHLVRREKGGGLL